jgi:flagellar hook-associated protein 1 FlgK
MADLLFTATSGLRTFQNSLNVIGHNVANVNTEGYSRQTANISAGLPQRALGGYIGSGANTTSITRSYQDYLSAQINDSYSYQSKYKTADTYSSQLNASLGDPSTGIFSTMQSSYQAWNEVANDPATNASSRFLLGSNNALQQQVQTYRSTRDDLNAQVNGQLGSTVTTINQLAQELVSVNTQLGTMASRANTLPNDLLDHRDQLVKNLNQYMDVKVFQNDNGTIDVYSTDGKIPLITDNRVVPLQLAVSPMQKFDTVTGALTQSEKQDVWIQQPGTGTKITITDNIKGGEIGGAISFRKDQLMRAEDELGLSVAGMSIAMNAQHRQGFDKAGVRGDNLFSLNTNKPALMSTASSYASNSNTGSQSVTTAGTPTGAFAYKLTYNGLPADTYDIVDSYSNESIQTGVTAASLSAGLVNFHGKGVTLQTGAGTPATGDSFMAYTSTDFYNQLEQTAYSDNRNTGTISNSAITINLDRTGLSNNAAGSKFVANDLSNPADFAQVQDQLSKLQARTYSVSFDGSNYSVTDARTGVAITATTTVDDAVGHPNVKTLRFEGLQVDVDTSAGSVKAGDKFELRFLNDGVSNFKQQITNPDAIAYRGADTTATPANSRPLAISNNVNAANLASMQDKKLFLNHTESVQGIYTLMIGNVGSYHQSNVTSMTTQDALYTQLNQAKESVSGVNLDEEAAKMMSFQQAYQAAAKMMQTAQTMFDTIIGIVR